jgi:hypothetical protein
MDQRVAALEKSVESINGKLDKMALDFAEMKGTLKGLASGADVAELKSALKNLASATELAEIKGRVNAMPTTIQLAGFVIAIFVASGMLRYFGH